MLLDSRVLTDDHPEVVEYFKHPNEIWKICACNYSMEEMKQRMRDVERQREENERAAEKAVGAKEDAERGRDWHGEGSHRL